MSLAVVCPSRGRPDTLPTMIKSALETSRADVLIYLDNDDPTLPRYSRSVAGRVQTVVGDPIGRGAAVNAICDRFDSYRLYLIVSDDVTFERPGWDNEIVNAMDSFEDDIGLVHLESENHETYANWCCVSRKWINTLGWFNYPGCRWFCQDTILQCLAGAIDRTVFITPPVIHHHVQHTPDVLERLRQDQDAFLWYMARNFLNDLAKLRLACHQTIAT